MESCKKIDIDCITKIFIDKNPSVSSASFPIRLTSLSQLTCVGGGTYPADTDSTADLFFCQNNTFYIFSLSLPQ